MRKITLLSSILILIVTLAGVLNASCTPKEKPADTALAAARQATVAAMQALTSGYEAPEVGYNFPDSARQPGWFDVNDYFSVLTHLSMQPGYTLDYIYHSSGSGAAPFLYARKTDSQPYTMLDELAATYPDHEYWSESDHYNDYLAYVRADDSEEAYFQYVVLEIMGGQFYLVWHAGYNDATIMCNSMALDQKTALSYFDITLPPEVQQKAAKLDVSPKVEIGKDTVNVRVVIFTKWGGFIEEIYTITRTFPHTIKDIKVNTLVKWNCGIMF